jgi:hypothetical protein
MENICADFEQICKNLKLTTKLALAKWKLENNNTTKASEILGTAFLSCLILHKSNVQTADETEVPAEVEKYITG